METFGVVVNLNKVAKPFILITKAHQTLKQNKQATILLINVRNAIKDFYKE